MKEYLMNHTIRMVCTFLSIALFLSTVFAQDITWSWQNPGEFYLYSEFKLNSSEFKSGGDVDSYGEFIYVNRTNAVGIQCSIDVYTVTIADPSKGSQHPDNPDFSGPVLARTLKYIKSYSVPKLAINAAGEFFATAKGIYFLGRSSGPEISGPNINSDDIFFFDFATEKTSVIFDAKATGLLYDQGMSVLGYDEVNDVWYASNRNTGTKEGRAIYTPNKTTRTWDVVFTFEKVSNSVIQNNHFDGLEVVATKEKTTLYLSEMLADFIAVVSNESGTWKEVSLNKYNGKAGNVEGMGYGAFNHFWITSFAATVPDQCVLYEIGSGGLTVVIPDTITVDIPVEQTFTVVEHSPTGTVVGEIIVNSSNTSQTNLKVINTIPEFEVSDQSPYEITVAAGADLDYDIQKVYQLIVVAYPDPGVSGEPDTSIITIHITETTGITMDTKSITSVSKMHFSVSGSKLTIAGVEKCVYNFRMVNVRGQDILTIKNTIDPVIDISSISSGIYYVSIVSNKNKLLEKICIK